MTDEPPSPFSREGSQPTDALGAHPAPAPATSPAETWTSYPPTAAPYTAPADPTPYADPGFDPQPLPPYGAPGAGSNPYEVTPPAAYGVNPYAVAPYQPAYGGPMPYGVIPLQHPKAVPGLVLGILGIVLAGSCGVGGYLGIGGIILGRQARTEIDAEPGRYTGRSQASAGIVTGTVGVVLGTLITIAFIVLIAAGVMMEGF